MIIDGLANVVYGSGRTTVDIDLLVQVELESITDVYECLTSEFRPLKSESLQFFKTYFVLPAMHKKFGVKVDISAALSGFERKAIERKKRVRYGAVEANFCSPEDLVLFKLVADRDHDIADVKEMIRRNRATLDIGYLREVARSFVEIERPDMLESLNKFFALP